MGLKDYQPVREMPETLVSVPSFIRGSFGKAFMQAYEKARKGNENLAFKEAQGDVFPGSNVLMTGLANLVFAQSGAGFRTVVPTDDIYKTIFPMIKGKHYADLNALDVWQSSPSRDGNKGLWEQAHKLARQHLKADPKGSFRIQGFYCAPNRSEKGYGVKITPAGNFRVIESDKLDLPTGTKFNSLDENGLVIPDKNGTFTKYTLGNGLSRVYLDNVGGLSSGDDVLAGSSDNGRVVVVSAEGTAQKFSAEDYIKSVETEAQRKIQLAENIRKRALSELEKL